MSNEGCPVRGLSGLCRVKHFGWPNPHNRQDGYPICLNWRSPHHSDIAATLCPGLLTAAPGPSCERRIKERRAGHGPRAPWLGRRGTYIEILTPDCRKSYHMTSRRIGLERRINGDALGA